LFKFVCDAGFGVNWHKKGTLTICTCCVATKGGWGCGGVNVSGKKWRH
jgi:hypothetical protein